MGIALPRGVDESMQFAKVKGKIDDDGIPVGVANYHPRVCDIHVLLMEFSVGQIFSLGRIKSRII